LKEATFEWLKNLQPNIVENEFCKSTYATLKKIVGIEAWQLKAKQLFNIESHYYTGQFIFKSYSTNSVDISEKENFYLYGLGIYAGVFPEREVNDTVIDRNKYLTDELVITIKQKRSTGETVTLLRMGHQIEQKNTVFINDVMFEKLEITNKIMIRIAFNSEKYRTAIPIITTNSNNQFELKSRGSFNCIAYILTSKMVV
jgi:hypothetical protein